jgi:dolichyl-phosphate beta-glucosyltransferase
MSPAQVELSVIVPAYNEAVRLPGTLRRVHEYLAGRPFTYEIIVVLDGPIDNTRDVVRELNLPNLKMIDRTVHRGKGYTVKEGMLNASGVIRLFSDADNSTDIAHFEAMKPFFALRVIEWVLTLWRIPLPWTVPPFCKGRLPISRKVK